MRLRDTVQSNWFKVDDIPGRERGHLDVTIAKVGMSRWKDGRESIDLYFHEHPKPLGANATNRKTLMMLFGEDIELEELVGQRIRLYATATQDAQGRPCWGVRVGPVPDTIAQAAHDAKQKIQRAIEGDPAVNAEFERRRAAAEAARQARPGSPAPHPRPMSHRPVAAPAPRMPQRVEPTFAPVAEEPAGFVDADDPGFDEAGPC